MDKADEMMVKRVAYYGINVSVPFIMMRHWDEWQQQGTLTIDDTDFALCRLVMDVQYMCQKHFFGNYWDHYFERIHHLDPPIEKRRTTVMRQRFALLPEDFTVDTIQDYCGVEKRNAEKMIERWLRERLIKRIEHGLYRKEFTYLI